MTSENSADIARQINPELWDKPSPEGSDRVIAIHRTYTNPDGSAIALDSVVIKTPSASEYTYSNYQDDICQLNTVFINPGRGTLTVSYKNIYDETAFATWRNSLSGQKIYFKKVPQINQ